MLIYCIGKFACVAAIATCLILDVPSQGPVGRIKDPVPSPSPQDLRERQKAQADDLYAEAYNLVDQGTAESFRAADSKFREARRLYSQLGDRRSEAYTLNEIVFALKELGKFDDALRYAAEALSIFRALKEPKGEATALNNLGGLLLNRGEYVKALEHYEQALPLRRAAADVRGEGITLNDIASLYFRLGRYEKALEGFNKSLAFYERDGDEHGIAQAIGNLGAVSFFLGENQKAIEFYEAAAAIQVALDDLRGAAVTMNNIGSVHADLRDFRLALVFYENSLPLRIRSGDRRGEATTLLNIGQVSSELGRSEKAWDCYRRSLTIVTEIGDLSGEAIATSNIGVQYLAEGNPDRATDHFYRALVLLKESGDLRGQAKTFDNLMHTSARTTNRSLAIFYGKQAVNAYQSLRSSLATLDRELQASFLRTTEDSYRTLIELLIRENRIPEAEEVLRMLKDEEYFQFVSRDARVSNSLNERIAFNQSENRAGGLFDQHLRGKTIDLEAGDHKPAAALVLDVAPTETAQFSMQLVKALVGKNRRPGSLSNGSRTILREWKDSETAIVSTVLSERNLMLIVTTARSQSGYVLPVSEKALNEMVGNFRSAVTKAAFEKSDPHPAAQALYDVLIKPIEKDLEAANVRTVVWSLDKFLRYVPVSALWDAKKGYVVQRYASVVLALAGRQNLGFRPVNKANWKALGVGTSKRAGNLEALTHVPKELDAIVNDPAVDLGPGGAGLIAGKQLLDEQFTFAEFRRSLEASYPFTHAATHFVFIPGTKAEGLNSYLLMGNGEKLTLAQVQNSENIFSGIELLTLSACDTGYGGRTKDGREIEGFGVLAQRKGARAIMATLWPVDDESTRDLMVEFYRWYLKPGLSKAEALRKAQLAVLGEPDLAGKAPTARRPGATPKRFANPYHWSPFILIGNWR